MLVTLHETLLPKENREGTKEEKVRSHTLLTGVSNTSEGKNKNFINSPALKFKTLIWQCSLSRGP